MMVITRGRVVRITKVTRPMLWANRTTFYVFGDNMARKGMAGQAAAMRGEPNAIGIPTKWAPGRHESAYFVDRDLDLLAVRESIIFGFQQMHKALSEGHNVIIPAGGLGTGLSQLPLRAPRIYAFIESHVEALSK